MTMSRAQFAELLDVIQAQEREVREAGQKEYAHDSGNALANFERISAHLGIPRELVLWVYLQKHLDGVLAYVNGHQSQREDIRGRLKDARLYLALLWGMIDDRDALPSKIDLEADNRKMQPVITAMLDYSVTEHEVEIKLSDDSVVKYKVRGQVTELTGDWGKHRKRVAVAHSVEHALDEMEVEGVYTEVQELTGNIDFVPELDAKQVTTRFVFERDEGVEWTTRVEPGTATFNSREVKHNGGVVETHRDGSIHLNLDIPLEPVDDITTPGIEIHGDPQYLRGSSVPRSRCPHTHDGRRCTRLLGHTTEHILDLGLRGGDSYTEIKPGVATSNSREIKHNGGSVVLRHDGSCDIKLDIPLSGPGEWGDGD